MRIARRPGLLALSAVLLAGGVLAACGDDDDGSSDAPAANLDGTSWLLQGAGFPIAGVEAAGLSLTFQGTAVSGFNGCNNFTGSFTASGGDIDITPLASTMMACPEPQMELADEYTKRLTEAAKYSVDGSAMTLSDGSGAALLQYKAFDGAALQGEFEVIGYLNVGMQAFTSPLEGTSLTANFGADGALSGSGGCNNYTATYEVNGTDLEIGPAASTRKLCPEPDGVMEQEAAFLESLSSSTSFQTEGATIVLMNAKGQRAVQLGRG